MSPIITKTNMIIAIKSQNNKASGFQVHKSIRFVVVNRHT